QLLAAAARLSRCHILLGHLDVELTQQRPQLPDQPEEILLVLPAQRLPGEGRLGTLLTPGYFGIDAHHSYCVLSCNCSTGWPSVRDSFCASALELKIRPPTRNSQRGC